MVGSIPWGERGRWGQLVVDMETDAVAHCGWSVEMGRSLNGDFDGASSDATERCSWGDAAIVVVSSGGEAVENDAVDAEIRISWVFFQSSLLI